MERLVKFEVYGQEFPLYTDAAEEDVQEILDLVKEQLDHSSKSSSTLAPNKTAILASINMAGKYVKLKRDFEEYKKKIEEQADSLSKRIGDTLDPTS